MAPGDLPLQPVADGVIVTVKLTPKARRESIDGISEEAGRAGPARALKVRVAAVPEDGKANAALIALLARAWDVPRTTLTLASGATQRLKRIHIKGDPTALAAKVKASLP
jgi:uncharacterized protein